MITAFEIEQFAKSAAKGYLQEKVSLNDSILKIAQDNDLNYEQTARVVEEANTQVYLNLFHKTAGPDRYVEFPTADIKKIASEMQDKEKRAGLLNYFKYSDYCSPPGIKPIFASKQLINDVEKTASVVDSIPKAPTTNDHLEKLAELDKKAKEQLYSGAVKELEYYIKKQTEKLAEVAIQDIYENKNYENYKILFNHVLSDYPKIAEYIISYLPKESNIEISYNINKEHWFYKEAENLSNLLGAYKKSKIEPKEAHEKIATWRNWALFGLGSALGVTGLLAYKAHKNQMNEIENSPLKNLGVIQ